MSFCGLMGVVLRRWYVALATLMCGAAVILVLAQDDGVFTTRTAITFRYPGATALQPYNGFRDKSVVSFASLIARKVNGGEAPATYASDSAPYYGAGIRQGVLVGLPNEGNQWLPMYRDAQIDIQVVGPTAGWVDRTRNELVRRVLTLSEGQQVEAGIPASNRIAVSVDPVTRDILHVVPSRTIHLLGAIGLFAAVCMVGAWAAVMLDSGLRRRTRRTNAVPGFTTEDAIS